jgi:hypothetical protein
MALGDREDRAYSAMVGAGGTATIRITSDTSIPWSVEQVSTEMEAAPSGSTCALRKNGVLITYMISTGDTAGGDPPVPLSVDDVMTVEWAGCTPGDIGKAYMVYVRGVRVRARL